MKIRVAAVLVGLLCAGCLAPRQRRSAIDWEAIVTRYDAAAMAYATPLFPPLDPAPVRVRLYRRRSEIPGGTLSAHLRRGNAWADLSRNEVHLPVWRAGKTRDDDARAPLRMLRHELAHLHLHRATAFLLPPPMAALFGTDRLPTAPWWVHEGWAAHIEDAPLVDGRVQPPSVNLERLRELQRLIRSGRCPNPWDVLSKPASATGNSAEAAVAWGLVHALLYPVDTRKRAESRDLFGHYLRACRRGFYPDGEDPTAAFAAEFLDPQGRPAFDWWRRWDQRVTREGDAWFRRLFAGNLSDDDWAEAWREHMQSLSPL